MPLRKVPPLFIHLKSPVMIKQTKLIPRERSAIQTKRLNFIRAAQALGIDRERFTLFLQNAISTEETHLQIAESILTNHELSERRKSVMEADLVRLIFEYF